MCANDLRDLNTDSYYGLDGEVLGSIEVIDSLANAFHNHIGRTDNTFYNYNLNCRYGIEMEFMSTKNRFITANRINNCIFKQNHAWWRNNYNAFNLNRDAQNNLPRGVRPLTVDDNDFDQYSSFFVEATTNHGTSTHKGNHSCNRRGSAGFKIEYDSSVLLERDFGITVWSNNAASGFQNTELKENVSAGHEFDDQYQGLEGLNTLYQQPAESCCHFSVERDTPRVNFNRGTPETRLSLVSNNELVSGVLTNARVNYPLKKYSGANDYREGNLPLGSLMIDNTFNHLLSHKSGIFVQKSGFHLHLSEFPAFSSSNKTNMIIGFIKLFYVFEPLLFSFFPGYRAESPYCRSLQSIFTRDEMVLEDIHLYNDLLGLSRNGANRPASRVATNRRLNETGDRYLSLNIMNCLPGGIGTVEIRLGHSTFDSKFVQAYIHFLQNLFHLNIVMLNVGGSLPNGRPTFGFHNYLLNSDVIPYYCRVDSQIYNGRCDINTIARGRISAPGEPGPHHSPVHGFFVSMGNATSDKTAKTRLLTKLYKLFYTLTNCQSTLDILSEHTNFYHTNTNCWLSSRKLFPIDIQTLINEAALEVQVVDPTPNPFRAIRIGRNYAIKKKRDGTFKTDYLHRCKTCVSDDNQCAPLFNNGQGVNRGPVRTPNFSEFDESTVYGLQCQGIDSNQFVNAKTQSELLTRKTSQGVYSGGNRRSKIGYKKLNKRSYKKIKKLSLKKLKYKLKDGGLHEERDKDDDKDDDNVSRRINAEADRIIVVKNKNTYTAFLITWMGTSVELELLSKIINNLIYNSIIDEQTLDILVDNRYIDYHIFTTDSDKHIKKLIDELSIFKIEPDTIINIIDVYNTTQHSPKENKNMLTSLPIYTPILATEE